jgi:hypothetical protein
MIRINASRSWATRSAPTAVSKPSIKVSDDALANLDCFPAAGREEDLFGPSIRGIWSD